MSVDSVSERNLRMSGRLRLFVALGVSVCAAALIRLTEKTVSTRNQQNKR